MCAIVKLLKGKRILIVEDNASNRIVVTAVLESYGALVSKAKTGALAVEMISETHFDLVLMDIQVPELNGNEATKIIRSKLKSQILIITLTGNAGKEENEKCLQAGMVGYLSKPFSEEELLKIVSEHLPAIDVQNTAVLDTENNTALYDLSQLLDIAKGNQQFIDKMLRIFIEQAPSSVQEIKNAYKANDFNKVMQVAHKIKPMIDMLGIVSLKKEVRILENVTDQVQDLKEIDSLVIYFSNILDKVVDSIKKTKYNSSDFF